MSFKNILDQYDYDLPKELIAQAPVSPRDHARLLAYDRTSGRIAEDTFLHLEKYLPQGAVLVFNQTMVIPARLEFAKVTGGKVDILYVGQEGKRIRALANRRLVNGSALLHKGKPIFTVESKKDREYTLALVRPIRNFTVFLEKYGKTPLPPYIKTPLLSEKDLRKQYQTVFARKKGSIAAPTASLHFTPRIVKKLERKGFGIAFITLHVSLGTFAPLMERDFETNRLHWERYEIDRQIARFLVRAKNEKRPIVAVGTTVVRALESIFAEPDAVILSGATSLFIKEGYRFRFVDGMITNFHVPKSSLMMLVAALIRRKKLLELYRRAIRKKFRFFSFGDGMLIV